MSSKAEQPNAQIDFSVSLEALQRAKTDMFLKQKLQKWIDHPQTEVGRISVTTKYGNVTLSVKNERTLESGTFKQRGAQWLLRNLCNFDNHITVASTGNHGYSVCLAAKQTGLNVDVFMPENTLPSKVERIRTSGGNVILTGNNLNDSIDAARDLCQTRRSTFIESTDLRLIFGHATLALELASQIQQVDLLFFPIGIGSGISGQIVGASLANLNAEIIGVTNSKARAWALSLDSKKQVMVPPLPNSTPGVSISNPSPEILSFLIENLSDVVEIDDSYVSHIAAEHYNLSDKSDYTPYLSIAGAIEYAMRYDCTNKNLVAVIC